MNRKYRLSNPSDTLFMFVDYQAAMFSGVNSVDTRDLITNVQIVANTAKIFNCKTLLTNVATAGFSGPILPELQSIFPDIVPIERAATINCWLDPNIKKAVKDSGCKRIVICGLWTSMCVTFPTIDMLNKGYDVMVITDACGDQTLVAHDMAIQRMIQAGATPNTSFAITLEYQKDWANASTYNQVTYLMGNLTNFKSQFRLIKYFQNNPTQNTNPSIIPTGIVNNTLPLANTTNNPYPIPPYHV